jgi:hypothetical protein
MKYMVAKLHKTTVLEFIEVEADNPYDATDCLDGEIVKNIPLVSTHSVLFPGVIELKRADKEWQKLVEKRARLGGYQ